MTDLDMYALSEVDPEEIKWLWFPYIAFGKVTIIQGDPGDGKTMLVSDLIAKLSKGEPLYEQDEPNPITVSIYQTAEDGYADTIVPRLDKFGADRSMVKVIREDKKQLSFTDPRIEEGIVASGAKVLILDPMQAYIGADIDMHRANEVRPVMHHLSDVAQRTGCAIILIGHLNKTKGANAVYRGLGSVDIPGAARSVCVVRHPIKSNDETYFAHAKTNIGPYGKTLVFEKSADNWEYIGTCELTADQLLNMSDSGDESSPSGSTRSKKAQVMQTLIELSLQRDEIPSRELVEICKAMDISVKTVKLARKDLGIPARQEKDGWVLDLRPLREKMRVKR